jgi:probable phosphoglycerate mutase
MRSVYVVIHAQSLHHIERKVGGWYDTSLTDLGRKQAEKTGRFLKSAIDSTDVQLFSSDLKRAAETAEIIGKHLQKPVTLDSRLREMSYGDAEGKPQSWFRDRIKPQPTDGNRLSHRVYIGAESRIEVAERVSTALTDILERGALDTVIVSHGFASTFLIMAWMKIPAEHMDYCNLHARPGSITKLHEGDLFGNRSVAYLSSIAHLGD